MGESDCGGSGSGSEGIGGGIVTGELKDLKRCRNPRKRVVEICAGCESTGGLTFFGEDIT